MLAAVTLLVYGPGLFGGFVWDDHHLIETNALVRDPGRLGEALSSDFWNVSRRADLPQGGGARYYRPVVTLAYALQFRAFGDETVGYHAVGLALHVACVLLVFGWLGRRLAGFGARGVVAAALGAALFALHPSRPESVSWISGSTDLWMTVFVLLGLHAADRLRGRAGTALAAAAFALALLSKEAALPVALLLGADAWLLSDGAAARREGLRRAAAVTAAVVAVFLIRLAMVPIGSGGDVPEGVGGAVRRVAASLGHYVALTVGSWSPSVVPACASYDAADLPVYAGWAVVVGIGAALCGVALCVAAWRRPAARPWLADAGWYVVPLLPVLNVVPLRLETLVANRYLYLPMLGVAALAARAYARAGSAGPRLRAVAAGAAAVVVLGWGVVSLRHVPHLHGDDELWTYEAGRDPGNLCAIQPLAELRLGEGRFGEALDLARRALAEVRDRPRLKQDLVLLAARAEMGSVSDADRAGLEAVRRFYDDLDAGREARLRVGDQEVALAVPASLRPLLRAEAAAFRVPRALAYARLGELEEAERQLLDVVAEVPGSAAAWTQLVRVRALRLDWDGARAASSSAAARGVGGRSLEFLAAVVARASAAVAAAGDDPVRRSLALADLFLTLDAPGRARAVLDPVLAERPGEADLIVLRAVADVLDGEFAAARERLEAARRADPGRAASWDEALRDLEATERHFGDRRPGVRGPGGGAARP